MKNILATAILALVTLTCPFATGQAITSRPYLAYVGNYAAGTTYTKSDTISYNGATYVSLVPNNTGHQPDISPTQWLALGSNYALPAATSTSLGGVQLPSGQTSSTLSKVALTGNYNDLSGTPAAPTAASTGAVSKSGDTMTGSLTAPSFTSNATGAGGGYAASEGPGATATVGVDNSWADSTAHRWMFNANGSSNYFYVGVASAATGGNCAKFAANGIDIVDAGATCGTSASNGFPFTLGTTSISAGSTNSSVAGLQSISTSGPGAGTVTLLAGSAPTAPTNSVSIAAPTAVSTPYTFTFPAGPPSSSNMQLQCSVTSGTVTTCSWGTGSTSGSLTGSTLAVAGFQVQAHSNANYTDFSWNGNHADGTYQGCSAATNTVNDPNIYCNVPSGGAYEYQIGGSVFEHLATGVATRSITNAPYSDFSFNGKHDGTRIGFTAAYSGSDNNLYTDVPSGGLFMFRVAQASVLQFNATSFNAGDFQVQKTASANYWDWSLNGNHTDGGRLGITADASGTDKTMYIDVPSGGQFMFRAGSSLGGTISAAGFSPSALITPSATPATSTAACSAGQTEWDANYIYICTATNTWKRAALGAF